MTIDEFKATLTGDAPPAGISRGLEALWQDGHGNWDAAHGIAQEMANETGAWIHAYLHRKEGDADNAAYWYGRARRSVANEPLDDEWTDIVSALLR